MAIKNGGGLPDDDEDSSDDNNDIPLIRSNSPRKKGKSKFNKKLQSFMKALSFLFDSSDGEEKLSVKSTRTRFTKKTVPTLERMSKCFSYTLLLSNKLGC